MRAVLVTILTLMLSASTAFGQGADCEADVNGDNVVDVDDLIEVILQWGCVGPDCTADVNGDEVVDVDDLVGVILDWGCTAEGTLANLSGVVTNVLTGDPVVGASVFVGATELVTDDAGAYMGEFEPAGYALSFEAQYFVTYEDSIILFPGLAQTADVALDPIANVVVELSETGDDEPGGTVIAMAEIIVLDGSEINTLMWSQIAGTPVAINDADTDTATVNLGSSAEYKETLIETLESPPIGPDDLPPSVPIPPEPFPGGLQDRFEVVGLNHFALEEAGLVDLGFEVTTTSGTYGGELEIHTHLPWKVATGLKNVPIGRTVLLHGKDQGGYDWALTAPGGSAATLDDPTGQNPAFTPDEDGLYSLTVTDEATAMPVAIDIYAGTWEGVITGKDDNGRPIPNQGCQGCHAAVEPGSEVPFIEWPQTGHAEIFTNNLNNSSFYNPGCFECHTVGFDPDVDNGGADDAPDYPDFLASGLLGNPSPDNWATVVNDFPDFAQLANAQCENCHGPQNTGGHGAPPAPIDEPRSSISSDVCATCHGEPLRHARFQQWQLSGHANYDLAIDESESGNCSRCHTGNGFLTWLPILTGDEPGDPFGDVPVTWTPDEAHPQTCVTCHDPHMIGTTSGNNTNATVRISGNTPPLIAGFTAYGVGKGAICMTCHNSRRGLRNDETYPDTAGDRARAPHGSSQTDMLMGENAYLVPTGFRGSHSFVTDACVACHMVETDPPELLSYNLGGANHTFYADVNACSECHDEVDGEYIQEGVEDTNNILKGLIEDALFDLLVEQNGLGRIIDLNGDAQITDAATEVAAIDFGEFRGRQSMTITFSDDTVLGPYRMNDIDVLDGVSMEVLGELYDFAAAELVKSGWNYNLVHNDSSGGVHNPSFAYAAMTFAIESLDSQAAATLEVPAWVKSFKELAEMQDSVR